ncbi:MAG: hypothetical protein Q8O01_01685, partial [Candidatus Omnitrophota bacterium]|nr:hypothetical protein [Candidatus Omnitrophota bacterium]
LILIMAFIVQDMSWAYPDHAPIPESNANNKLAPLSFFMEKDSSGRVLARVIELVVDKNLALLKHEPALKDAVLIFLSYRKKYPDWFGDTSFTIRDKFGNVKYSHIGKIDISDIIKLDDNDISELLVNINPGSMLRYFNPEIETEAQNKYSSPTLISINSHLHKERIETKAIGIAQPKGEKITILNYRTDLSAANTVKYLLKDGFLSLDDFNKIMDESSYKNIPSYSAYREIIRRCFIGGESEAQVIGDLRGRGNDITRISDKTMRAWLTRIYKSETVTDIVVNIKKNLPYIPETNEIRRILELRYGLSETRKPPLNMNEIADEVGKTLTYVETRLETAVPLMRALLLNEREAAIEQLIAFAKNLRPGRSWTSQAIQALRKEAAEIIRKIQPEYLGDTDLESLLLSVAEQRREAAAKAEVEAQAEKEASLSAVNAARFLVEDGFLPAGEFVYESDIAQNKLEVIENNLQYIPRSNDLRKVLEIRYGLHEDGKSASGKAGIVKEIGRSASYVRERLRIALSLMKTLTSDGKESARRELISLGVSLRSRKNWAPDTIAEAREEIRDIIIQMQPDHPENANLRDMLLSRREIDDKKRLMAREVAAAETEAWQETKERAKIEKSETLLRAKTEANVRKTKEHAAKMRAAWIIRFLLEDGFLSPDEFRNIMDTPPLEDFKAYVSYNEDKTIKNVGQKKAINLFAGIYEDDTVKSKMKSVKDNLQYIPKANNLKRVLEIRYGLHEDAKPLRRRQIAIKIGHTYEYVSEKWRVVTPIMGALISDDKDLARERLIKFGRRLHGHTRQTSELVTAAKEEILEIIEAMQPEDLRNAGLKEALLLGREEAEIRAWLEKKAKKRAGWRADKHRFWIRHAIGNLIKIADKKETWADEAALAVISLREFSKHVAYESERDLGLLDAYWDMLHDFQRAFAAAYEKYPDGINKSLYKELKERLNSLIEEDLLSEPEPTDDRGDPNVPWGSPARCIGAIIEYCDNNFTKSFSAEELIKEGLRKKIDGKTDYSIHTVELELRRLRQSGILDMVKDGRKKRYILRADIRNLSPPQILELLTQIRQIPALNHYDIPKNSNSEIREAILQAKYPISLTIPDGETVDRRKKIGLLWQERASYNNQIEGELLERVMMKDLIGRIDGALKMVGERRFNEAAGMCSAMLDELGTKMRVKEKRLGIIALGEARKNLELGDGTTAGDELDKAKRYFAARFDNAKAIVGTIRIGKLGNLRARIVRRNNKIIEELVNSVLKAANKGDFKTVRNLLSRATREFMREPEFRALMPLTWKCINDIRTKKDGQTVKFEINSIMPKLALRVSVSQVLNEFMGNFMDKLSLCVLEEDVDYRSIKEEVFRSAFQEFLTKQELINGPPDLSWTIFYQAAFIPLEIGNPLKRSERIPNPVFEAADTLILMKIVDDMSVLDNSKKFREKHPETIALLRKVISRESGNAFAISKTKFDYLKQDERVSLL